MLQQHISRLLGILILRTLEEPFEQRWRLVFEETMPYKLKYPTHELYNYSHPESFLHLSGDNVGRPIKAKKNRASISTKCRSTNRST